MAGNAELKTNIQLFNFCSVLSIRVKNLKKIQVYFIIKNDAY